MFYTSGSDFTFQGSPCHSSNSRSSVTDGSPTGTARGRVSPTSSSGGSSSSSNTSSTSNMDTTTNNHNNRLYEVLNVSKTVTTNDIKKAYRKLIMIHHPDKGGDEQKFKEIHTAYEILYNEERRKKYDLYGFDSLNDVDDNPITNTTGTDPYNSMFFHGKNGIPQQQQPLKGDDITHTIKVTLSDLYNGKIIKLAVNRRILEVTKTQCTNCDGTGCIREIRQVGVGAVQQIQRHCSECKGDGNIYQKKRERNVLEINITPGMRHGQKITFPNMADEKSNCQPGDVHFIIQEEDHPIFKRKGADLCMTKTLSLKEALTGFAWKVTHLDGRDFIVQSKPGEMIRMDSTSSTSNKQQPSSVKVIPNEGMPCHENPFVKGRLFVLFRIEFPRDGELSPNVLRILRDILPGPDPVPIQDNSEVVHLEDADSKSFGKGGIQSTTTVNNNTATFTTTTDQRKMGGPSQQEVNCQQS